MQGAPELKVALKELAEMARSRRPDDAVLADFVPRYYDELPGSDVDDRRLEDVYAVAVAHLDLGRVRTRGTTVVRVVSPQRERDGWESPRSTVFVVTDDAPFLVDTIRMVVDRHQLGIHLVVHPMLAVERDAAGRVVDWNGDDIEAWTQIEIDRCSDAEAAELEAEVASAIEDVQHVVADFPAMCERITGLGSHDPLIAWLASDHFVYLGAADYRRSSNGDLELIAGSGLGQLTDVTSVDPPPSPSDEVLVVSRSDADATIHRPERQVCLQIRPPGTDVEHRFIGLLGATAFRTSVFDIPTVGDRAQAVLDLSEADPNSYLGREVRGVVETLPRELVFELDEHTLAELVIEIVGLQERQLVRVLEVPEPVGPWRSVLAFLPRKRYTGTLPERVAEIVAEAYGGEYRNLESRLGHSSLARISVTVRRPSDRPPPSLAELGQRIDSLSTSWADELLDSLINELGETAGRRLFEQVGRHAPASYRDVVPAHAAIADLQRVAPLLTASDGDLSSALVADLDAPGGDQRRFKVYRRATPIALAEILPLLDQLGLTALDEHPFPFRTGECDIFVYDMRVRMAAGAVIDDRCRAELHRAFAALMNGEVESDGFNRLIVRGGLTTHEVAVLRAYAKYLRQIGFAFSQQYIEATLVRHGPITRQLVALFTARFDPALGAADSEQRVARVEQVRGELMAALDAVPSLDEDRICRAFCHLIDATVRTNAWRERPAITFKLDPSKIPDLPLPRPAHEIWVCSPDVEGVHLRGGPVARGGLRWSDRREDFRTEVLGLMKAQMVKNSVIVPVGAKGGFVVKRPSAERDQYRQQGVECYKTFIRGMLDVTDNIVRGDVAKPPDVVCHDGDDTYLVAAADKGTGTFSDIANEVAAEYRYWLGDAFASGGSAGYDHKAMGITSRGAWESVRRHASVLGKDAEEDVLTAVGIGDMSGDVFGNGMLRSPNLKLIAAFDHRDIFIDPDPDPATAFAERQRLFALPRSSWQDYDAAAISAGGAVYSRSEKAIVLSDEARRALDAPAGPLTPHELIAAILRAPVDLLWNGGIGTYVKCSDESNDSIGDRANDGLRVNGLDMRAKMIGEGGNLGVTQLGRVEYALNGGLIYTDAVDNSAGVDCSDHEVNIKILLNQLVADEELTTKQRNALLESMADDVAEMVLDNNRAQTLALMLARRQSAPMANVHARYLEALESDGVVDRQLEFLPSDKQLADRQASGTGLRAPEFAVLMAYTKNANVVEVVNSDLPDDPALEHDLFDYFPPALRERFPDAIRSHRLRRELIATQLVNQVTNLSGISFEHRMTEDTGSGVAEVVRGWVTARNVFDFPERWEDVEALRKVVPLDVRADLLLDCRRMNERGALWLLRHRHPPFDIGEAVEQYRPGLRDLAAGLTGIVHGQMAETVQSLEASRLAAGVPESLAERSSVWRLLHTGFDLVDVVAECANPERPITVLDAARIYWSMFEQLELKWVWDGVGALPRSDRWQTQARSALRDDLLGALADLTRSVITSADGSIDVWMEGNQRSVSRSQAMFTEIRRTGNYDVTNLCVALRQLRNLVLTAVASPATTAPTSSS